MTGWIVRGVIALVLVRFSLTIVSRLVALGRGAIFILVRLGRFGPIVGLALIFIAAMFVRHLLERRRSGRHPVD